MESLFRLLRTLSAPGSSCLVTFLGSSGEVLGPGSGRSSIHSFFCDTGAEYLKSCGWSSADQVALGVLAEEYGRPRIPLDHGYFIVNARVDA